MTRHNQTGRVRRGLPRLRDPAKPSVVPLVVATTVGVIGFLILLLLAAMSDESAQAERAVPAVLATIGQTWR